jgi:hypothetical protein
MAKRLFWILLSCWLPLQAADRPQLWGYGVKSCTEYMAAWEARESGGEFLRYQDWLTGLVSGLSLATGLDVIQGVEIPVAMRRIELACEDKPEQDFFNASMDLIRLLSRL